MTPAEKIAEIYKPISDDELTFGIAYLQDKIEFLSKMGERFHFAWKEVFHFCDQLVRYREARKPSHLQWREEEVINFHKDVLEAI